MHELMIDSGCYGHVCPPWFAPQFPLVGCTNIEAVIANNATLRHFEKWCMDTQILIQITFDVMSVRKPFLSTSALKRRGVTIIFNHDYDRIIFRNETLNLISHDCHSYLHLTLADGIPRRKAMVMTGENVTNAVNEEVYVGDGVVSQEAQEASAGDLRAIADADQAGQRDISGETRAARALRTPEPPTDAKNGSQHDARTIQRVVSFLRGEQRTKFSTSQHTLPKFQADYTFIRTLAESKTQPCSTFVETSSGAVISFMCARKGGYEELTKEILRQFESYGFLNPVIVQCDKETSIIDVCRKLARERKTRTVLRFAPTTSHQCNGFFKTVHGQIQGFARCYQTQIETNTGTQLSAISRAIPFAVRYAGSVLTRFTVRPDDRTPFQYLLGTP